MRIIHTIMTRFPYPLLLTSLLFLMLLFYILKRYLAKRKIQTAFPPLKRVFKDTFWSALAPLWTFPTSVAFCVICIQYNYGFVYHDIHRYGTPYFILSIFLLLVVYDANFYWWHRLLHLPFFFRNCHKIHHYSHNPTMVTFFAMHPLDCFLFSLAGPISLFLFPVHPTALVISQVIVVLSTIYAHSGYELYIDRKTLGRWGLNRWLNSSLAHNLHHQNVHGNFGFYFLFWDRLCGTLDQTYPEALQAFSQKEST